MSSALAIAAVSAVLKDLLNDGLIQHNAAGVLGSSVTVSVGPPDRVVPADGTEASQLNLFLYQVSPNPAWLNMSLPSRSAGDGQRLANAPLALNLHYLLSAYSGGDLHGEILLGYALQLLHENAVLPRQAIHTALTPSPDLGGTLPAALRALAISGLENQAEQIKISPEYLSTEDLTKLWTATQSPLRPSASFLVSVVLIASEEPARSPLPVLSVGPLIEDGLAPGSRRARGVAVQSGLIAALPHLATAEPAAAQPAAQLGTPIALHGHHLASSVERTVMLTEEALGVRATVLADPAGTDAPDRITFAIPASRSAEFPVGVYSLSVRLLCPGEGTARETNRLGLTLAPRIEGLPLSVARDADGTARFTLAVLPEIRPGQRVSLLLDEAEFVFPAVTTATGSLSFAIENAPPGAHLARLRVDGIESPIVDATRSPPVFADQRLDIL
ncbi:DUF4255 domain-containing protein [Niveibacterium terrae]|uniref:DUF4255 domain-containing protein n=1 Tax=Niveibacterium terrae TaxID=3373598 RepID=UPI003A911BB3